MLAVTEVRFKKTTCLIADDCGTPTLLEESSVLTGFLETKTLELGACERGSMKDVFVVWYMIFVRNVLPTNHISYMQLRVDGNTYVAKKLVNAGSGRSDCVPISDATNLLTADLIRLKRMAYFASKFKSATLDQGIDVAGEAYLYSLANAHCSPTLLAEFDVSDGFLMKIYKPAPAPAPAANENEIVGEQPNGESLDKSHEEVAEVYLVEPMRLTSAVVKFSGTLGSTTRTDLRSSTMAAFAHYVAQETACQCIFADIQGLCPCSDVLR